MKRNLTLIFALFGFSAFGQTTIKVVKTEGMYLNYLLEKKALEWFTIEPDDKAPNEPTDLPQNMIFKLNKRKDFRVYLKWMNPLLYRVTWIDSIQTDQAYSELNGFVTSIKQIFAIASNTQGLTSPKSLGITDSNLAFVNKDSSSKAVTWKSLDKMEKIEFPSKPLLSSNVREFYFLLQLINPESLNNNDRKTINSWKGKIEDFDANFFVDHQSNYTSYLDDFLNLKSSEEAVKTTISIKKKVEERKTQNLLDSENIHISYFSGFKLENKLIEAQLGSRLQSALNEARLINQNERDAIEKMIPIINLFEASTSSPSNKNGSYPKETIDHFKSNSIKFKTGEQIKSTLTISEFSYDKKTKGFTETGERVKRDFIFQKYNFIYPTISTGVFYSDVDIVTYGLSNSANSNEFLVTQDTLQKNTALVAAFANFNFDLNTDFFHPFVQLGIDPTKVRPYMMLGGGFYIPASKFAISGGTVLTWQQSLKTLKVGDSVSSTSDLQNDIKYGVFDIRSKGWYLGIQYNF